MDRDETAAAWPDPDRIAGPGEPLVDAERTRGDQWPATPPPAPAVGARWLLATSLVLIAFNLRPVFSSLSVVLPEMTRTTGLQPGTASLMTVLPVFCLGAFAPLAPGLAQRFGAERTILALLGVLAFGTALRGLGTAPALFCGAALAGAAIGIVNVLLPGLVKRDFPDRLAVMTGLFTMALSGGAALAAGLTVPIQRALGGSWAGALAAWALPCVLVGLLWAPQAGKAPPITRVGDRGGPGLWRSLLAWQVTLFMGLQSLLAYCVFGYLAPILRERGLDAATAGWVVSFSVVVQCVACLGAPLLAVRRPSQSVVNVGFFALALGGILACMFAPLGGVWIWGMMSGLGQGGVIALAMTAIVLRTGDARMAAQLSGMAQGVGYVLASFGPLMVGVLRGLTGSYAAAAIMFVLVSAGGMWCGFGAGRDLRIRPGSTLSPGAMPL